MGKKKSTVTDAGGVEVQSPAGEQPTAGDASVTASAGSLPVMVLETLLYHPDEIVVDEQLNSRDSTGRVEELARDLLRSGQLEPIRVRLIEGYPHLVFGYRRYKASVWINEQGLADPEQWPDGFKLRAEVVECNDGQCFAANVSENDSRKDLSYMEKVRAMDRLVAEFGWTHQQVADHLGMHRTNVGRALKLLTAPRSVQKLIATGKATAEAVLEILSLPEEEQAAGFAGLQEEVSEGKKATKTTVRKKRKKAEDSQPENKRLTLKEIRAFWEGIRDEQTAEGVDPIQQILAGWVCRHMDGKWSDRVTRSRLAGLKLGK